MREINPRMKPEGPRDGMSPEMRRACERTGEERHRAMEGQMNGAMRKMRSDNMGHKRQNGA